MGQCFVKALESILNATGAQIVVSSTWKDFMTIEEIQEMWKCRELPGAVIGTTPSCSRHRGDEIDAWLADCDTTCEYVIIDDMDESQFNEHQHEHLFTVNPYDGLNDEVASEIIEHFHYLHGKPKCNQRRFRFTFGKQTAECTDITSEE